MRKTRLYHLHAITLELDNEGLLDCVDGYNEAFFTSKTHQNSFYAAENTVRNPDALANFR